MLCLILAVGSGKAIYAQNYQGYRIGLFNFEWTKKKKALRCSAVNTGRESLVFDKKNTAPTALIVEIDTVSLPQELLAKKEWVRLALLQQSIDLKPGQLLPVLELTIKIPDQKEKPEPIPAQQAEPPTDQPKPEKKFFDYEDGCPDLVFDSVWVEKMGKSDMTLGFVVLNQGKIPAKITGKKKRESDNVAVNVYFISGDRLTRGALLADGVFIGESKDNPSGILASGARMGGTITVSTEHRTKFSPNVLFELDPFQTLLECDETNNTRSVELPFSEK